MICNDCDYAGRPSYKSPCSECDKTKGSPFCCWEHEEKPTNADRIRAMSDEELSVFLWEFDIHEVARDGYFLSKKKITEWLNSEYKEN